MHTHDAVSAPTALPSGPVYEAHGVPSAHGAADIARIVSRGGSSSAGASHTAPASRDEPLGHESKADASSPPAERELEAGAEEATHESRSWSRWCVLPLRALPWGRG